MRDACYSIRRAVSKLQRMCAIAAELDPPVTPKPGDTVVCEYYYLVLKAMWTRQHGVLATKLVPGGL